MKRMVYRLGCGVTLAVLAIAVATGQSAQGDDTTAPPAKTVIRARLFRARLLPPYYSKVVNEEQKVKIHKIEEEYQPKIDALKSQLDALQKERDEKIAAVLTPEQQKQVEDAKAKAKADKAEKKAGKPAKEPAKPAETTPATPTAPTTDANAKPAK